MSSKSKTNPRFENFWTILSKNECLEIPEDAKDTIYDCLELAGYHTNVASKVVKNDNVKNSETKKVSAWNIFMKEQMVVVKADESIKPSQRMGKISEMWRDLGEDGKIKWCEEHNISPPKSSAKKTQTGSPKKKKNYKKEVKKTEKVVKDDESVEIEEDESVEIEEEETP